jgi:hypothetical protein
LGFARRCHLTIVNPPWAVVGEFSAAISGQIFSHRFMVLCATSSIDRRGGLRRAGIGNWDLSSAIGVITTDERGEALGILRVIVDARQDRRWPRDGGLVAGDFGIRRRSARYSACPPCAVVGVTVIHQRGKSTFRRSAMFLAPHSRVLAGVGSPGRSQGPCSWRRRPGWSRGWEAPGC